MRAKTGDRWGPADRAERLRVRPRGWATLDEQMMPAMPLRGPPELARAGAVGLADWL